MTEADDSVFDRPVFIISPPRSGSTLLFETLLRAPDVYTGGGESHQLIETIPALHIAARGYTSNRLDAGDATPDVVAELRRRFRESIRDRNGARPMRNRPRMLEKTPKNSLRIPFLIRVFPEAHFVFLHREPRQVLASMIEAWRSGRFQTYRGLPGWPLPYWSLLLTPGWQALAGKPLPQIVAAQWQAASDIMLDDLAQLPPERWIAMRHEDFVANPAAGIARLCAAMDYDWDQPVGTMLPHSRYTLTAPDSEKWRRHAAVIEPLLPQLQSTIERVASVFADTGSSVPG